MTNPARHGVCRAPRFGEYTVVLGDRCTQNACSTPCPHHEAHSLAALEVPPLLKQIVVSEVSSWVLCIVLADSQLSWGNCGNLGLNGRSEAWVPRDLGLMPGARHFVNLN